MKLIPKIFIGLSLAVMPALCGPISSFNQWYAFGWSGTAFY